jgi:ribosomal protein L29
MGKSREYLEELRCATDEQLREKEIELKKQMLEANQQNTFRKGLTPNFKPHTFRTNRKKIAQIKTILTERK